MKLFLLQAMFNICISAQRVKKVLSDRPGLVDFAIGLVNSVLTCPTGK